MSLLVGELYGALGMDSSDFDRGMDKAHSSFGSFGGIVKAGSVAAAAAVAMVGAAAVKSTIDFVGYEKQMNEVFTLLPGITDDAMKDMSKDVRDFAREFGTLPNEVVPALYQSISAGVPQDNVFSFLEVAQKAAVGGVTELSTAVDGITSVVNAYGADVMDATKASDLMFTAVKLGKTDFTQLSASLFQVIPTASALGVEFGDVTAGLAALTAQGTPTSVATTQMRQMLVELSKAGGKTSDIFLELAGVTFKEFIAAGGNTQDALQLLEQHAQGAGVGINDLFGSVEAGNAALGLTGKGTEKFRDSLAEMADSAGATDVAFETMEKGLGRAFDRIKASFSAASIELGERLSPAVSTIADLVIANMPMIQAAVETAFNAVSAAITFIVEDVMPPLVEAITWFVQNVIMPLKSQFEESMGGASGAMDAFRDHVLPVIETVWRVIQKFVEAVMLVWNEWGDEILAIVQVVFGTIWAVIKNVFGIIEGILDVFIGLFTGDWERMGKGLLAIWDSLWEGIAALVYGAWRIVEIALGALLANMKTWFSKLITDATSWGSDMMKGFLAGITGWFGKIASQVGDFVGGITDKVKGALGISSPSKVFAEIGANLGEGLAIGISGTEAMVARALDGIMPSLGVDVPVPNTRGGESGGGYVNQPVQMILDGQVVFETVLKIMLPDVRQVVRSM